MYFLVELLASSLNARAKKSLFGVMNRCSTTNGTKHLRAALFQPSVKVSFTLVVVVVVGIMLRAF